MHLKRKENKMLFFDAQEKFNIPSRGDVYYTQNPVKCTDFDWLMGQEVEIYFEKEYIQGTVKGIEAFCTARQFVGQKIGLLIKEKI